MRFDFLKPLVFPSKVSIPNRKSNQLRSADQKGKWKTIAVSIPNRKSNQLRFYNAVDGAIKKGKVSIPNRKSNQLRSTSQPLTS